MRRRDRGNEEMKRAVKKVKICPVCEFVHPLRQLGSRKRVRSEEDSGESLPSFERRKIASKAREAAVKAGVFGEKASWFKIRGVVSYNGSKFHGFQRQQVNDWTPPTVQTALEEAFNKIFNRLPVSHTLIGRAIVGVDEEAMGDMVDTEGSLFGASPEIAVRGASRTDSQVHATCQVFQTAIPEAPQDLEELTRKVNQTLGLLTYGSWVCVREMEAISADENFDVGKSSCGKQYCYTIYDGESEEDVVSNQMTAELFSRGFRKNRKSELVRLNDREMHKAAQGFIGTKNFRLFTRSTIRSGRSNFERTMYRARVLRTSSADSPDFDAPHNASGDYVHFLIEGDGFLLYMVRSMMTALLDVGLSKRSVADVLQYAFDVPEEEDILKNHLVFKPASPRGLTLAKVYFPDTKAFQGKLCPPSVWPASTLSASSSSPSSEAS